ncbi:peroxide stress protein YaaA [Algoriphagus sp. D3-2-R+10]|uniref:peroxide stress protein YaaA n=1 Tax=Algoriphagus aurantiacus TaxID=3103948 RepID=UPI002B37ABDC|nr:peroxide stress protein YaaA [Algoriphagus sp. D3-2-R+10]MEB2774452.1 peroxide stress protein YaaA [Algoriphagus sp. D3-2-R+10]
MLILISPAKTLDYSTPNFSESTQPDFQTDTHSLVRIMKKKSATEISELMHISDNLAELNNERFKTFQKNFTRENSKQAILAFKGDVYTKIDVDEYSKQDFDFAQDHLRILSGLYGLLKPLDLIQPYRLEMGIKLENKKGKNLYEFWDKKIAKAINEAANGQTIVNLASQEYFKAVHLKALKSPLINIEFKEYKDDSYKIIGFFAKQARGMMSNFAIKNRIADPEQLKTFNGGGYEYSDQMSDQNNWIFVR